MYFSKTYHKSQQKKMIKLSKVGIVQVMYEERRGRKMIVMSTLLRIYRKEE
jgi:hypothetical protein